MVTWSMTSGKCLSRIKTVELKNHKYTSILFKNNSPQEHICLCHVRSGVSYHEYCHPLEPQYVNILKKNKVSCKRNDGSKNQYSALCYISFPLTPVWTAILARNKGYRMVLNTRREL